LPTIISRLALPLTIPLAETEDGSKAVDADADASADGATDVDVVVALLVAAEHIDEELKHRRVHSRFAARRRQQNNPIRWHKMGTTSARSSAKTNCWPGHNARQQSH